MGPRLHPPRPTFVDAEEVQELTFLRDQNRQLIKLVAELKTENRDYRNCALKELDPQPIRSMQGAALRRKGLPIHLFRQARGSLHYPFFPDALLRRRNHARRLRYRFQVQPHCLQRQLGSRLGDARMGI